jgi:long-chain fatty acid transport protein
VVSRLSLLLTIPVVLGLLAPAAEGGGIMLYELGTREVGLASAGWAARADDPVTVFTNPAGLSRLEGQHLMFSGQLFYGDFGFQPDPNTTVSGNDGGNPVGAVPGGSLFYSRRFSDRWSGGIGVFSYFGLSSDYQSGWVGRYYVMESTLIGATLMPSVSYRASDRLSFGLGVNLMYGIFDKSIAINNLLQAPDGLMQVDTDAFGVGVDLGALWEITDRSRVGLTYLSPVKLNFKDVPEYTGLRPVVEDALRRNGLLTEELDLGMTVPQILMLSGYHVFSDHWSLMGNVGWQNWQEFGLVSVALGDTSGSTTSDRDYENTWHAALGTEVGVSETLTLIGGLAYDSSCVSDANRTLDAPMSEVWRFGIGGMLVASDRVTLNVNYELAYMGEIPVDEDRGPLSGRVAGNFDNAADTFAVNVIWKL